MDVEVLRQAAIVKEVSGDVVAVKPDGSAKKVVVGDTIPSGEIVITANHSTILMESSEAAINLDANTLATEDDLGGWGVAPVAGEVNFDLAQLGEGAISEDELAAIQDAILAGADPTELLEATAAGAGAAGSANGGFVTIEYNGTEVLASTFFETSGFSTDSTEQVDDEIRPIIFADGGQSISEALTEGSLSGGTYPQSVTSTVTIFAADLSLDPTSFVPEPLSLASLLSELNSDITSNGESVTFTYNATTNTITGVDGDGNPVLTIDIDATSVGRDVGLELTTTILQPIDHTPSVGGGQVAFTGDQITVSFEITGTDTGGNSIQAPIDAQVTIGDGTDPSVANITEANVYEAGLDDGSKVGDTSTTSSGTITFAAGSDDVTQVQIDVDAFNSSQQTSPITSQGQTLVLEAVAGQPGVYVGFITLDGNRVDVLRMTLNDVVKAGTDTSPTFNAGYSIELLEEIDHPLQGQDSLSISLPVFATDADNDQSVRSNLVVNVGDDIQVVTDGTISVVEPTVGQSAQSNEIDVITEAGADQGKVSTVTFDGQSINFNENQSEYPVTDGKLVVSADGKISFIPNSNVDHSGSDDVKHTIVVTVTDKDGDTLTSNVELTIKDGADPVITNITQANVYEAGLTDGSKVGDTVTTATGDISFTTGSDTVVAMKVDVAEFNRNSTLESSGQKVVLEETTGPNGEFTGQYAGYITQNGVKVEVMKVTLDQSNLGKYTVTLLQEVDHGAQGMDSLAVNVPVYAVDQDNDNSANVNLKVNIGDDIQVVTDGTISVVEPTIGQSAQSNEIDVITEAGADQGKVSTVTFDGQSINFNESQTEYPVTDGKLVVSADGKISFIPNSNVDHSGSDEVKHTIVVTVKDNDGDELTSTVDLTIKDGADPVITNITQANVYEAGLTDGSKVGDTVTTSTGDISFTTGSDTVVAMKVDVAEFNRNSTLESSGQKVVLEEITDPNGEFTGQYAGYITQNGVKVEVLNVTLDQSNLGKYTVTLSQEVDHGAQGMDSLAVNVPVYAVDQDNDNSANVNLKVNIGDDIQVVTDGSISVVEPTVGQSAQSNEIDVITEAGADQGKVSTVTFDGQSINFNENQSEYLVTDGKLVVSADGKISFIPNSNVDHSGSDEIKHTIVVTVKDSDGDELTSTVDLTIKDGADPVINTIDQANVYEAGLTDGSKVGDTVTTATGDISFTTGSDTVVAMKVDVAEFNRTSTLESAGQKVVLEEITGPNGEFTGQYAGYITQNGVKVEVMKVTLDQSNLGKYTVTLSQEVDHGAQGMDSLAVNVPVYAVDKDNDNSANVNLKVNIGDDIQVVTDGSLSVTEPTIGQSAQSNEIDVITEAGADQGKVSTVTFDGQSINFNENQTEYTVTDGKLVVSADGKISFIPNSNVDHSGSDEVKHTIVVTVKDSDGDELTSTVDLTIKDGADPVITNITQANVYEAGLTDGSKVGDTVTTATGDISFTTGSDTVVAMKVDVAEFNHTSTLESAGKKVVLEEITGPNGEFTGQYTGYITQNGVKVEVLKVTLDQSNLGKYTVTLSQEVDHGAQGMDSLAVNVPVYAVDKDSDNSANVNLKVNIGDDIQVVTDGSISVVEPTVGQSAQSNEIDVITEAGADQGKVSTVTFDGQSINFNENQSEYPVTDGKLVVSADGKISFIPNSNVDHSGSDEVKHTIVVTVKDSDGDELTSTVDLTIKDGADPVINTIDQANVYEAGLTDGSKVGDTVTTATGDISFTTGSDTVVAMKVDVAEFNRTSTLESAGQKVVLEEITGPNGEFTGQYAGYITQNGVKVEVLKVTLDQSNLGKYTVTLSQEVDHGAQGMDSLAVNVPVYAVDNDNDNSANVNLQVNIGDDIQVVTDGSISVVEPTIGQSAQSNEIDVITEAGADQGKVSTVTFDGQSINFNENQNEYPVTDGKLVVSSDGKISFIPNSNVDHSASEEIKHTIVVTVKDNDGDELTSTVDLTIKDGADPVINTIDQANVYEAGLTDGSKVGDTVTTATGDISFTTGSDTVVAMKVDVAEFNRTSTLESAGQKVVLEEVTGPNGEFTGQYAGYITQNGVKVEVLNVTLDQSNLGKYTVTLSQEVDHGAQGMDSLAVNVPVYAVDQDNDNSANVNLKVNIGDDIQVVTDGSISVVEPTVGQSAQSNEIDVITEAGADQGKVSTVTFDGQSINFNENQSEYPVTDGKLVVSADGKISFIPNSNVDHSASEEVKHTIVVTVKDNDGDELTSTVELTITDGADPVITNIIQANVYEAGLTDGSKVGDTVTTATGDISFTTGSDTVVAMKVDVAEFNRTSTLESAGQKVVLEEITGPNGEFTGQYAGYITQNGVKVEVLNVTLDQSNLGKYTVTLSQEVDHGAQGMDSLAVNVPVYAVDQDNDNSANVNLKVNIGDDTATIDGFKIGSTFSVNEDDTSSGSSPGSATATGSFITTEGADTVVKYELVNINTTENGLKSGGFDVDITKQTGTSDPAIYQGKANGELVFTLELNSDGSYTYTQIKALDHAPGSDSLMVPFDVVAIDRDGDVSPSVPLAIEVKDDKPILTGTTGEKVVDEDALTGIGSDQSQDTQISGNFVVNEGADGVVEYELVDADNTLNGLESGGESLEWAAVTNSGTVFTYTAQTTSGVPVFTIKFDTADNSYTFNLLKPLDHPDGDGQNSLDINFKVKATDFDGDESGVITLPIQVTDDIPQLTGQSITRIEGQNFGGSKVDMFADETDKGADNAALTKIEGTTDANGAEIVFGGPRGTYLDSVDLRDGRQNVRVYEQTDDGNGGTDTRQLGILRINSNGEIEFRATNYLEHNGDEINFKVNVTATDGDNDTSIAPLDITITDREARPIALKVTTFEDAGRDSSINYASGDEPAWENAQDNQAGLPNEPAKVSLSVNLFDRDNAEDIGQLTIKAGNHRGTFYYEENGVLHELKADANGDIIFDGTVLQQSFTQSGNNTIATIDNLYFVPDRNYSTGNGGVRINYQLQIDNNGTADHTVDSNFRIEVESVADIATWNDSRSTYQYQVEEDGDNVRIQLRAETQDTSRPETITYELKVTDGEGHFELLDRNGDPITPVNGVYTISAQDINRIQVNPADNYSGQIRFEATAVTTERSNPYNDGTLDKESARSEPKEIIIDVTPDADMGSFSVNRIQINEDNIADPDYTGTGPNHEPFTLNEVITMNPSVDTDGSETLHVRISDITEGASLVWVGSGSSQITTVTVNGETYQEIPYDQLGNVEVVPDLHSNIDFKFDVTGVVKDTANLSGNVVHVDEAIMGTKTVNVAVKGVADTPENNTGNSADWKEFTDGSTSGVETTIDENGSAEIKFSVESGEFAQRPADNSESITVLLSNIPDGVVIEDASGNAVNLNFTGYDSNGQPIYEANITNLGAGSNSGIVIRPVSSSTENIHIKETIIVTENDGHSKSFEREIRVKVQPVIDTSDNYKNTSVGDEDSPIDIKWHPKVGQDYTDTDEHVTSIKISGIPDGSTVYVDGQVVTVTNGSIEVVPSAGQSPEAFTQAALQNGFIQITPPKDSSTNFDLQTTIEIEEVNHEHAIGQPTDEVGRAQATLNGTITVKVNPVVEPEDTNNRLIVENEGGSEVGSATNQVVANSDGSILFTTNTAKDAQSGEFVIRYLETDASGPVGQPNEVVTQLVVQFDDTRQEIMDQLFIEGAVYEGNGRWVITDEDAFSIKAPNGLDYTPATTGDPNVFNDIGLTIYAQVVDKGDDDTKQSVAEQRETKVTLSFPEHVDGTDYKAGVIDIVDNSVVTGTEDTSIDLGTQLKPVMSVISHDNVVGHEDTVTIVIDNSVTVDGKTFSIGIGGSNVDFTNGQYVFKATLTKDGVIEGLDGLTLIPPKDYSGDFRLPLTVITTDNTTGDEISKSESVIIKVDPIADVKDGANPEPEITLEVKGSLDDSMDPIDQDGQGGPDKVGYEDSYIQLDLGYDIADKVTGVEGGKEVLSSVTLTLADTTIGEFYDQAGKSLGPSVTFTQAQIDAGALDNILFRPKANYPTGNDDNKVTINVTGTVTDTATFNELGTTTSSSHSDSFTTSVSFEVAPVVDDVKVTGPGSDPSQTIEVTGNEDEAISLGNSGAVSIELTDTDGSESFVSIKFTDVPDGFLLIADPSSGYTVKNNGNGEWSVKVPAGSTDSLDLSAISVQPPKHFSGSAEFGVAVFTQESLLGVPTAAKNLPNFKLTVNPVGDIVDTDPTDSATGSEGQNIDIAINASVIDKAMSATGSGTYTENAPETIRVEVTNVPQDAKIFYPDGTTLASYDPATKVWTLDISAQQLDKIVFNSGEHNSDTGNALGIDAPIHIAVQSNDNGALGPKSEFDVDLVVDPINDQPTFVNVVNLDTSEDVAGGLAINQLSIADVDATYDDPDATYTLTLQVDKGTLEFVNDANVNFTLAADGSLIATGKLADINAAIAAGKVIFKPDADSNDINSGGPVTVTAIVDDGGNNGAIDPGDSSTSSTNQTTFLINVTEVNDAPEPKDFNLADLPEEGSITINVQDLIDGTFDKEGDTITVESLTLVEGQGTLTQQGGNWVFEAAKDYNGPVKISYVVKDDGTTNGQPDHLTGSAEINFDVTPVNDKPVLDIDDITSSIDEASSQQLSGINVSDIDYVGASANDLMTVTLNVDYGKLSIVLPAGSGVTATGEGSSTLTLSGTLADLNALLDTPTSTTGVFIDASLAPSNTIALDVTAKDSWNPSGLRLEAEPKHYDITVNPVANAPTLAFDSKYAFNKNITATQSASTSGIAVLGIMAALTDTTEALTLEVKDVPPGATLESTNGTVSFENGVWHVSQDAIDTLTVKGATVGDHTLHITAVSEELDGNGQPLDRAESVNHIAIDLNVVDNVTALEINKSSQTEAVHLDGSGSNSTLTGGSGDDLLVGGAGNDTLIGGAGDDTLMGGEGNDTLEGGLGSDILVGGTGMDVFVWREIDDGSLDTIKDFSVSEGDKIDLREVLPELKSGSLDMDTLLEHLDVKVDGNNVELHVHPGGDGTQDQGILVENLVPQLDSGFSGMSHEDMVSSLLQHVMVHDNN
ncbi:retention module-containing protein [Vibrio tubiashii]|uniref:retention module-containing protein n=1 Tax=Vibrio tubiashii TaxID=29498 RepID=UPI003CE4B7AF